MIKYILRNMWRRKARTFLTVFGIVVGIFALTVLGGLSARLTQQVQGARSWFTSSISVVPSGSGLFGGGENQFFDLKKVEEVKNVPGVEKASAGLGVTLAEQGGGFSFGAPDLLIGLDLSEGSGLLEQLAIGEGRPLQPGDRGKVTLGSVLAEKRDARVGDTVKLRGEPFEVVGIYRPTLSAPDTFAFAAYEDVLPVFLEANPFLQKKAISSVVYVIWEPGADPEAVAARIKDEVEDVNVISPRRAEQQISQFSLIFNAILLGIALIALLVGGLSVINTMIMSVSERTREIGLKRAIGAETRTILSEYLLESATIGLLGGLVGMLLGLVVIWLLNSATASQNVSVFAITVTVVVGPVIFATVLGTVAGIFPALRAARLRPVESLKED
ncbi:MAG: ABC transporter permease [Actinobacteria bacterium]|nr:ABC transporter permease [Actinomycetota bacterium]MBU1942605.1 ABC transporter permease [Actinomycetota bacterium]MBU2688719.1 ABC transporter permease [Actinomycetota bacterium]